MKYTVKITQNIRYSETLIGEFDSMKNVSSFVDEVFHHFDNVKVEIIASNESEDAE